MVEYLEADCLFGARDKKIMRFFNQRLAVGIILILFVVIGVGFRFYQIAQSDFIFFDEGYYLNDDRREYVDFIAEHPLKNFKDFIRALYGDLQISLGSGKPLWIFLTNLRVFVGHQDSWFFPRILSAIAGCLTLWMIYVFARKYFNSSRIALLSLIFLAILPSHVFYSRLALQEVLSTLFFLLGIYFYIFPRALHLRTFLSAVFLMLAYFTNYRMIVIPALIAFCELYISFDMKQRLDFRKYFWHTLIFFFLVIMIACIDKGQHITVILPWMMHQTTRAQQDPFHWYNFFSYPYFTFRLESIFFGILFWGNLYNVARKRWRSLLPFFLACVQMFIFSLPEEKGARYICVVLPFIVMAAAALAVELFEERKDSLSRIFLMVFIIFTVGTLVTKSWGIVRFQSDYRPAMEYMMRENKYVKVVTSQKWVMNLYSPAIEQVRELPHILQYLISFYGHGFKYLVIDPQAYVSWTKGGVRFYPKLEDYLGYVTQFVKPIKVFSHLNPVMLERFVFEHNENLKRSIDFLALDNKELGTIRIYDIEACLRNILPVLKLRANQ